LKRRIAEKFSTRFKSLLRISPLFSFESELRAIEEWLTRSA
jgi:hypothetical protein